MVMPVTIGLSREAFYDQLNAVLPEAERGRLVAYPPGIFEKFADVNNLTTKIAELEAISSRSPLQIRRLDQLKVWLEEANTEIAAERAKFMAKCWGVYSSALASELPMLLGSNSLRVDRDTLANFGMLSSGDHSFNAPRFGGISRAVRAVWKRPVGLRERVPRRPIDSMETRGSILSERYWSVLLNDVAILGVIHGRRECILWDEQETRPLSAPSGTGVYEHEFWDGGSHRTRMLARELLMLKGAGYIQAACSDELSVSSRVFVCKDPRSPESVTLVELFREAMVPYKRKEVALDAVNQMFEGRVPEGEEPWKVVGPPKPRDKARRRTPCGGAGGPQVRPSSAAAASSGRRGR